MPEGRVWIADFIFTTCTGPCPRMSSQMRQVQKQLGDSGVKLVSFTVDPNRDTPEVLARYAQRYEAKEGVWYFLTGPKETLHRLNRDVFKLGDVAGNLDHSTRFILVDAKGRIRGFYPTDEQGAIDRIVADARRLAE